MLCRICPRDCNIDRAKEIGYCRSPEEPRVAKAYLHKWEEPCLSGTRGSGTVFFSGCSLACLFCQNYAISQQGIGKTITAARLAEIFLELQAKGAHNINLVTPTHYTLPIIEALQAAKKCGLTIPVVHNGSGYEKVETLRLLEGLVDIYLPDIKYFSPEVSARWSKAPDYFRFASAAALEMYRQVGAPEFDDEGLLRRGLMIRHMLLPTQLADSQSVVDWVLANLPREVYLNLLCQYTPLGQAHKHPAINRRLEQSEYETLVDYAWKSGLVNGYVQDYDSASEEYVPDFNLEGV